MDSRERIIKCLKGEKTDRIPISTYEICGYDFWEDAAASTAQYDTLGFDYKSWYHKQPSFTPLLKLIREKTDCIYLWGTEDDTGFAKALTGFNVPKKIETHRQGISTFNKITIETPKGPLTMSTRYDDGVNTTWETEHLLKDADDVEKLLSIPYEKYTPSVWSYKPIEEKLGEKGVMMPNIGDPLLYVAELFGFTNFVLLAFEETALIERLLEIFNERVLNYLDYLLESGVGGMFRIVGPEYATPPYLPPHMFKSFVCKYDTEMIRRIKKAGAFARVHSHGNIGRLLDDFASMEPDAIDPVESAPYADVSLGEVKKRIGDKITIMGNLQLKDLELKTETEIVEITRQIIDEAAEGGRFVFMPTASPITEPLPEKVENNYRAFIETVHQYGKF